MRKVLRSSASALLACSALAGQAAPFAYIAHDSGVAVIDTASHTLVGTIGMRAWPSSTGVVTQAGASRAYVVNLDGARVIDIRSQRIVLELPTPSTVSLALSPVDSRAVAIGDSCAFSCGLPPVDHMWLQFVDTVSRAHEGYLPIRGGISGALFHPVTNQVLAAQTYDGARILTVDPSTRKIMATLELDALGAGDLHVQPSGSHLYVVVATAAWHQADSIHVIDLANNARVAAIPLRPGDGGLVGSPDGSRLYMVHMRFPDQALVVIDTATNRELARVPVNERPTGLDVTPDGRFVYVVTQGNFFAPAGQVDVVSTETHQVVARIPLAARGWLSASGRFIGGPSEATPAMVGPLSGMFWNATESGWGIHLTQRNDTIFAALFTYGGEGAPRWYAASSCELTNLSCPTCYEGAVCTTALIESRGPDILGDIFDPGRVSRGSPGQMRLQFRDVDRATLSYEVNGVGRTVEVQRQNVGDTSASRRYSDLWWNRAESGWGLGITQQGNVMFLSWFVYDRAGNPVWYVASRCEMTVTADACSGRLYRASGPRGPHRDDGNFDQARVHVEEVGSIRASFNDDNNGVIEYVLHGVAGRKTITRQLF